MDMLWTEGFESLLQIRLWQTIKLVTSRCRIGLLFLVATFVATVSISANVSGQTCHAGDCQPGVISGPYSTVQTAENTASNFPLCKSAACTSGSWPGQIEGLDAEQNIGSSYQFYDQGAYNIDTNIAVGRTLSGQNGQVLQWVNNFFIQAFDKVTGQPQFTFAGGTLGDPRNVTRLWSASTQAECQGTAVNVQVIYDRLDDVFVISRHVGYTVGGISHYAWCLAVSSAPDLSKGKTVWYAYEYKMDTVIPCVTSSANCTTGSVYYYYPDWPRIGTWSNGFYITFDLLDPTHQFSEAGFEACQLDRAHIVRGAASNPMTCYSYLVPGGDLPSLIHSVDVSDIDSAAGPPAGEPEYFLSIVNPSNAQQQGGDGQNWCNRKASPCTSNQLALFSWGSSGLVGPSFIAVNPYTPGCYDTSAPGKELNTICVPEPTTNAASVGAYGVVSCGDAKNTPCIDSLGDRMANRLTYNKLTSSGAGPNGAYLTASHVVMESAANQSTGIRYYILSVANGTASVLVNSGASGPPDLMDSSNKLFFYMPSAALDAQGNLGITYTTSGLACSGCQTQPNPAVYFDVLPWGATSPVTPTLIVQGSGDEENTVHWGEYAATDIDPTDNLTFYGMGEYFNTSQTGVNNCASPPANCHTWQTKIFRGQYGVNF